MRARLVFDAIVEVWRGENYFEVWQRYKDKVAGLPGYPLDYILAALDWILDQEDINYTGRPEKLQRELDTLLNGLGVSVPEGREGSQLAMALLAYVVKGLHPVEALIKANLDVQPRRRA